MSKKRHTAEQMANRELRSGSLCSEGAAKEDREEPTARARPTDPPARSVVEAATIAILLAVIAVGLRSFRLGSPYITRDESFSWRITQYPPSEMLERIGRDGHPPLHFFLLDGWTALWGDSTAAIRSLSVVLGAASVLMVYWLAREGLAFGPAGEDKRLPDAQRASAPRGKCLAWAQAGATTAALVVAVHPLQVTVGRTGRMYSLGMLLAALSAWMVLRAIRAERPWRWWIAYGIVAAAFCYTHYFASFSILAQVFSILAYATYLFCQRDVRRQRQARTASGGLLLAGCIALALYSPWLPVVRLQTAEVFEQFWIPRHTALQTALGVVSWGTGLDHVAVWTVPLFLLLLAAAALLAVWRGGCIGWFFLLQAVGPWVCCLAVSRFGDTPLFQVRYLTFAQVGLAGLWGVLVTSLPTKAERIAVTGLIVVLALAGLLRAPHLYPQDSHASAPAIRFLCDHYQHGDLILVADPAEVNQTRHAGAQLGFEQADVRCLWNPFDAPGFMNHIASLSSSDVIWHDTVPWTEHAPRIWRMSQDEAFASVWDSGLNRGVERTFEGSEDSRVTLVVYVRNTRKTVNRSPPCPAARRG